jgi:hypothetical protein
MALSRPLASVAAVALVAFALLALLPDCASACSCAGYLAAPQERAQRALKESTAVFSGQVVNIGTGEPGGAWRPATVTVSFQVSEVWKGPQPETLEVSTPRDGASCGYPFKEGQEYLVYAYGKEELFKVSLCSETKPLSEASADLEALGNGESMGGGGALVDTSGGFLGFWIIGMLGLAMAAVSSVVLLRLLRTS